MVSLEEAQSLILNCVKKQDGEVIDIFSAKGRVLAEDILSKIDSPPFDRSPLDGYAVRSEDLKNAIKENGVILNVIDKVYAGYVSKKVVNEFEAVRIMTGAKIPKGADTVVRQEDTKLLVDNKVEIFTSQKKHDNFIFKGEDFKKGSKILETGTLLKSSELMAISSIGINQIKVFKKPRVAVITTGDELQNPGEELMEGRIYNSNRIFLKMRLEELGCEVIFFDSINDDEKEVFDLVKKAEESCDILISTGGVSVGEKDIVQKVVRSAGYEVLFWKVDIKPGSPMFAAVNSSNKVYIGLSGTPVAAATTFELTVRNTIAKMLDCDELKLQKVDAVLEDEFKKISKKRRFLRVYLNKENKVYINKAYQSPGQINTMLNSNAILEVQKNTVLNIADKVKVYI